MSVHVYKLPNTRISAETAGTDEHVLVRVERSDSNQILRLTRREAEAVGLMIEEWFFENPLNRKQS